MLMKYRNTRSAVQNIAVGSSESSVEEFLVIPVIARHAKCPKTISLSLLHGRVLSGHYDL